MKQMEESVENKGAGAPSGGDIADCNSTLTPFLFGACGTMSLL